MRVQVEKRKKYATPKVIYCGVVLTTKPLEGRDLFIYSRLPNKRRVTFNNFWDFFQWLHPYKRGLR